MTSPLEEIPDQHWATLSNATIAASHSTNLNNVAQYRRLHKKPKGPRSPGSGRKPTLDLSRIDWTLSNTENAALVGCTSAYICALRRKQAEQNDFA